LIGYVQASDTEQAVKEAIVKYEISKPHEQAPAGRPAGERDQLKDIARLPAVFQQPAPGSFVYSRPMAAWTAKLSISQNNGRNNMATFNVNI
jgi:hypothetical protein